MCKGLRIDDVGVSRDTVVQEIRPGACFEIGDFAKEKFGELPQKDSVYLGHEMFSAGDFFFFVLPINTVSGRARYGTPQVRNKPQKHSNAPPSFLSRQQTWVHYYRGKSVVLSQSEVNQV